MFSNLGVLQNENVCLDLERLDGDWLMLWNEVMELRQYLVFINFIYFALFYFYPKRCKSPLCLLIYFIKF